MTDAYHEPREQLRPETIERHRALRSIIEELEAVDWYDQRVDASGDAELRAVLAHSRDEEKEHATMTLEWLRRRDPVLDANLRKYLFKDGVSPVDIEAAEEGAASAAPAPRPTDGSLGIGSLRRGPA